MKRYLTILTVVAASALVVSGCSTVPKKVKKDLEGLRGRVDTLESRVETVEGKQSALEMGAANAPRGMESVTYAETHRSQRRAHANVSPKRRSSDRVRARTQEIQACLKNANFYQGAIDGVKGKATRRAIREFQKANGLHPDGVVGPRTWALLSKYASAGESSATEKETIK